MERFPDHIDSHLPSPPPSLDELSPTAHDDALCPADRWRPAASRSGARQPLGVSWESPLPVTAHGRDNVRRKSLGDAIRTIRSRTGSVGQNAQELAGALRAPVSPRLVVLCVLWYLSSALTNTSSKAILNAFDKPATLTLIQFACVACWCVLSSWLARLFPSLRKVVPSLEYPIRAPSKAVLVTTLPLAAFQIGGHLLSSTATAKIPVSLVHTIKGLSPLFTVLAYRLVFDIRYPRATYLSLIPLTFGVMLACSGKHHFGGELLGVICALLATFIFVSQNIFSKRLFNEVAKAEADGLGAKYRKLDMLNLLCYSSALAFSLTIPIWLWSEGFAIFRDFLHDGSVDLASKPDAFDHGRLGLEFVFNGTFHFGQSMLAFILLSLVSPVTYSVASLIKRVFVIVLAIIWFQNPTTSLQAFGIGLTILGLYLYDRTSESNKADRKARMMINSVPVTPLLPTENPLGHRDGLTSTGWPAAGPHSKNGTGANGRSPIGFHPPISPGGDKKTDGLDDKNGFNSPNWLLPGTRQEETWQRGDGKKMG